MADPGGAGGPTPSLFLDQTEARRAEHRPRPPPLSQGLDPALKTKSFADPSNTASLHRQTVGVVSSRKKFLE